MQEVRYDGIRVSYIMPGSVNTYFGGKPPDATQEWKIAPSDVAQVILDLAQPSVALAAEPGGDAPEPATAEIVGHTATLTARASRRSIRGRSRPRRKG